jgi:hypothetical protein
MQWLALGVLLGIVIYWTITLILVRRVRDRHLDAATYVPILWGVEPPKGERP